MRTHLLVVLVLVGCKAETYIVGGNVDGSSGEVRLMLNAAHGLNVAAAGPFQFSDHPLRSGESYAVTVQRAPEGQTCSVARGNGTIGEADVSDIVVTCADDAYTVGGTASGITTTGLVLRLNGSGDLSLDQDGVYTFADLVADGGEYAVTVHAEPADTRCTLQNATGTIDGANVTNVNVTCADALRLGGIVDGLVGGTITVTIDGVEVTLDAIGGFMLPGDYAVGEAYSIAITGQPTGFGQTCTLTDTGNGTVAANPSSVLAIQCQCALQDGFLAYELPKPNLFIGRGGLLTVTGNRQIDDGVPEKLTYGCPGHERVLHTYNDTYTSTVPVGVDEDSDDVFELTINGFGPRNVVFGHGELAYLVEFNERRSGGRWGDESYSVLLAGPPGAAVPLVQGDEVFDGAYVLNISSWMVGTPAGELFFVTESMYQPEGTDQPWEQRPTERLHRRNADGTVVTLWSEGEFDGGVVEEISMPVDVNDDGVALFSVHVESIPEEVGVFDAIDLIVAVREPGNHTVWARAGVEALGGVVESVGKPAWASDGSVLLNMDLCAGDLSDFSCDSEGRTSLFVRATAPDTFQELRRVGHEIDTDVFIDGFAKSDVPTNGGVLVWKSGLEGEITNPSDPASESSAIFRLDGSTITKVLQTGDTVDEFMIGSFSPPVIGPDKTIWVMVQPSNERDGGEETDMLVCVRESGGAHLVLGEGRDYDGDPITSLTAMGLPQQFTDDGRAIFWATFNESATSEDGELIRLLCPSS